MKFTQIVLTVLIAAAASWAVAELRMPATTQVTESVYDRVMRTGTLRCGYFVWPPFLAKDPNTGAFSGIAYDMANELAKAAELKIEWAGEISFSTYLQDISSGRYDAECADGWANAVRGKYVFYSKPYAYVPIVAVVRADDTRFDVGPQTLNSSDVTIVTMDGETSTIVARTRAPDAQQLSLPQNSTASEMMLNVADGKADVTLTDALSAHDFIKANPGKVKAISYPEPLHLVALGSTLAQDPKMKALFDVATDQLLANGTIEAILKRYEPAPGLIWRVNEVAENGD